MDIFKAMFNNLAIVKSTSDNGIIASLDVESLFTNISLMETIEIIIYNCYNHQSIEQPKIPKHLLKNCSYYARQTHLLGTSIVSCFIRKRVSL